MRRLWACFVKEILLLVRDKAALTALFLMPAVLVLVMTLIQENVESLLGGGGVSVLVVDEDGSKGSIRLAGMIQNATEGRVGGPGDTAEALKSVGKGSLHALVRIPQGFGEALERAATQRVEAALSGKSASADGPRIELVFDPGLMTSAREAVSAKTAAGVRTLEFETGLAALFAAYPRMIGQALKTKAGVVPPLPSLPPAALNPELFRLAVVDSRPAGGEKPPAPAEHNVPSYAVFGMFFLIIPLAGGMIRERMSGTTKRLATYPTSRGVHFLGKTFAYLLVCCVEAGVIFALGIWGLPLLGVTGLQPGPELLDLPLVVIAVGLAAAGLGVLLGTILTAFEQAAVIGSILTVILAALGGVMIPTYAMPEAMRDLAVFSPLNWAQSAVLDVVVRGRGVFAALDRLGLLVLFSGLCLCLAFLASTGTRSER